MLHMHCVRCVHGVHGVRGVRAFFPECMGTQRTACTIPNVCCDTSLFHCILLLSFFSSSSSFDNPKKGKYFGTKLAWGVAADAEGSMKEMSLKKPITANVASHKYGSEDYTPQVNPRTERSSEPVAFLGGISVSTYVDTPDKLPAAPATKASNAMGQYGEGYQPKVTPKSEVPTAPKNVITTNTPALIPAEVMPPVVHTAYAKKLTERVKGSYTEGVYTPPVVAVASKVEDDLQVEDVAGASYVQAAAKVVDAITTEEAEEDGGADTGDGGDGGDAGAAEELTEL